MIGNSSTWNCQSSWSYFILNIDSIHLFMWCISPLLLEAARLVGKHDFALHRVKTKWYLLTTERQNAKQGQRNGFPARFPLKQFPLSGWRNLRLDIKGMLSEATSNAAFPSESLITGLFWRCPKSASTTNSFVLVIKKLSPQWTSALVRLAKQHRRNKGLHSVFMAEKIESLPCLESPQTDCARAETRHRERGEGGDGDSHHIISSRVKTFFHARRSPDPLAQTYVRVRQSWAIGGLLQPECLIKKYMTSNLKITRLVNLEDIWQDQTSMATGCQTS